MVATDGVLEIGLIFYDLLEILHLAAHLWQLPVCLFPS